MNRITIFDSTLRDGAQAEGVSFSVEDKIKIVRTLDELGVGMIEAGNPGSNPKDMEFFERIKSVQLKNSILTAFGSTRRRNISPKDDSNIAALLSAGTKSVAIFGKSWDFHVTDIIGATLTENLEMIYDTVAYLKEEGKHVTFDAEHFFDGYKNNREYAFKTVDAAVRAGADCVCLCDTNGGTFPDEIYKITKDVCDSFQVQVGIHAHNDCGMATANTLMAVKAGATQVQGTFTGFGERCGNASLATVIPNLQVKRDYKCIPDENVSSLTHTARKVSEIANLQLSIRDPFVGQCAFAHKGGMHVDGVMKNSKSFEHIDPSVVGNERKFLTSEVAGRNTILSAIQKIAPDVAKNSQETTDVIEKLKALEYEGYQFEGAEGGFELLIRKTLGKYKPFFELETFKIIGEHPPLTAEGQTASAVIKVKVDDKYEITAAEGDGPVNALDKALRKALEVFYPSLSDVHLTDYKVRVLNSASATASKVRVLIESSDGNDSWTTVGVSKDIIEASWIALVDSIEYKLIKDIEKKFKTYI
ncbi:MAG TPA: citramalate synthase [Lachnospiraceae bacterium]|nr:citramalate synthase [Lachnospiraceae bacterium]